MEPVEAAERKPAIAAALEEALMAQGRLEGIDITALAEAVERALTALAAGLADDGKRPDELNSTNDG
jgi:hypothetical protein